MLKIKLILPQEEIDYLQRFAYELEARKRIVKEIITDTTNTPAILETELFKKYHERYETSSTEFDIAKSAIEKQFVPAELIAGAGLTNWNLEYNTAEMTINYSGDEFDNCTETLTFAAPAEIEVISGKSAAGCSCGGK